MRHIFWTLILLSSFCCRASDTVKFRGKITAPVADSIEISFNTNYLAYYPQRYVAHLDKTGAFQMSFTVPKGVFTLAQLQYGNSIADILLSPGDSLYMTVNAKRFDSSVHYAGRGANTQNFLADYTIRHGRINQYSLKIRGFLTKDPADFLKELDGSYTNEVAIAKKWVPALPPAFTRYWNAFHQYYNYFIIEQYPQARQMVASRRYTDTISDVYYKVVDKLPLAFNDSFLQVPSYFLYLTGILEVKLKATGYTWHGRDTTAMRNFEDSVYKLAIQQLPSGSKEYYMAQSLYGRARTQPLSRTEAQLTYFKNNWSASNYLPLLEKQVGIARRLAPGQPAPDIEINTPDGKQMHLSDLKGKVVYLGFWAEWCKQCIGEMISERMVKDLIRKKPLEFVYVSIGADTAIANQVIEHYHLDGLHTRATGGWQAKEVGLYGVQSLPAYYLIDEDGNFAAQIAPSPQQTTELVKAIERLFK